MGVCKRVTTLLPVTFAWTLLLGVTGAFYCLVYVHARAVPSELVYSVPEMLREFKLPAYIAVACEVCVFFMVVSNFFATTVMDPAIYPKGVCARPPSPTQTVCSNACRREPA
jgi:hypothetical protein